MNIHIITVGTLKESYWRDGCEEYIKRLSAFGRTDVISLKEYKLPAKPGQKEIRAALDAEGEQILKAIPPKSVRIALCVEGKQYSSEELASSLEKYCSQSSDICFIIGSSFGLSETVKDAADLKLSLSSLTFPHQMTRLILLECIYRSFCIINGTPYHK